jgi:hypothetical protein
MYSVLEDLTDLGRIGRHDPDTGPRPSSSRAGNTPAAGVPALRVTDVFFSATTRISRYLIIKSSSTRASVDGGANGHTVLFAPTCAPLLADIELRAHWTSGFTLHPSRPSASTEPWCGAMTAPPRRAVWFGT